MQNAITQVHTQQFTLQKADFESTSECCSEKKRMAKEQISLSFEKGPTHKGPIHFPGAVNEQHARPPKELILTPSLHLLVINVGGAEQ